MPRRACDQEKGKLVSRFQAFGYVLWCLGVFGGSSNVTFCFQNPLSQLGHKLLLALFAFRGHI